MNYGIILSDIIVLLIVRSRVIGFLCRPVVAVLGWLANDILTNLIRGRLPISLIQYTSGAYLLLPIKDTFLNTCT